MRSKALTLFVFTLVFTFAAFAADVTGKWTAMVPGRNGEQQTTFTLKQQGDILTGTVSGRQGERPIAEGKVTGDTITFSVDSQRGKQTYTGKISGGEIQFKREGGQGQPREFTAKRAES